MEKFIEIDFLSPIKFINISRREKSSHGASLRAY